MIKKIKSFLDNAGECNKHAFIIDSIVKESFWIQDFLSAEVSYASLTLDGTLREPVFIGLINI